MATRRLEVEITGDASSLNRALGKTQDQSNNLMRTFGKAGLAGAAIGLGVAVKAGFSEFVEAQRVTAQTNAVLKSTGGTANVTSQQVQKLSEALMRKSGVDDEAIQSGQNMLLTFTKIRNEVGAGNNIFDQATRATLDLSVAMGKDMQSSAILVGKALNDPIKGMSALSRAGIQFTEEQKTTIKTMVATGDTMGAQKMILKELETQFGGSAEAAGKTFGGQVNIAKESLLNLAGDGVAAAMPALTSMATFISTDVIPVLRRFHNWFQENIIPVLKELARVAGETWDNIAKKFKEHEPEIKRILGAVESAARAIGTVLLWIFNNVWLPVMDALFTTVIPTALGFTITALDKVFTAIDKVRDAFVWMRDNGGAAIGAVWSNIKGPLDKIKDGFGAIADAVGKIVSAVKWLAEHGGGALGKVASIAGSEAQKVSMPSTGFTAPQAGVTNKLWDEIGLGNAMGLHVSSGLRPGDPGDHGRGHAIDMVGSRSAMAAFAAGVMGRQGIKDVIYGELPFWQDNGVRVNTWAGNEGLRASHAGSNAHVHVSAFDDAMRRARFLMPGLTLAYNGTGRPEPVGIAGGFGSVVNVYVSGSVTTAEDLVTAVRDGLNRQAARNGGTHLE